MGSVKPHITSIHFSPPISHPKLFHFYLLLVVNLFFSFCSLIRPFILEFFSFFNEFHYFFLVSLLSIFLLASFYNWNNYVLYIVSFIPAILQLFRQFSLYFILEQFCLHLCYCKSFVYRLDNYDLSSFYAPHRSYFFSSFYIPSYSPPC